MTSYRKIADRAADIIVLIHPALIHFGRRFSLAANITTRCRRFNSVQSVEINSRLGHFLKSISPRSAGRARHVLLLTLTAVAVELLTAAEAGPSAASSATAAGDLLNHPNGFLRGARWRVGCGRCRHLANHHQILQGGIDFARIVHLLNPLDYLLTFAL